MTTIRALIVDDEPLARRYLRQHLEAEPDVEIAGECGNSAEAVTAVRRERPDLMLLDIEMPDADGFELIRELGADLPPLIVFVTAYDDRAVHAFRAHALDYLVKPVDPELLREAVCRARAHLELAGRAALAEQMQWRITRVDPRPAPYVRRLLLPGEGRSVFLDVERIDWIEAVGNHVLLHVGEGAHRLRTTLTALEEVLDPADFIRIHRSTIVHLDRVDWIEPYGGYDYQVVLTCGRKLRVGRGCRDRLLRLMH